ncbi:uncharacterized protein Gasu_24050 [Galdieria sulphuraria]|uniref:Protein Lines N-terminal domain-containing protein n=1 Tax=Galdieria sulphuraria TaxID=130081 RepID=M2Y2T3_GALSU|nr:uncharacterized protein Gasu_24050 [Galdieria sulphuraria]EME30253.1 hypothetical protein Gasu_24050 [Galdieria sulphuraria]|eukprot:XP_005706773.1 hypothetical protein Gasu_24050 [Galdieria sulphuraria]
MNGDWIRLQNLEKLFSELLKDRPSLRKDEEDVLSLMEKLPKEEVLTMLTNSDSLVAFRCSCLLSDILTKGLYAILTEQREGLIGSEEMFKLRLESLFSSFAFLDLFVTVEPVFLYRLCRFYARVLDNMGRLLQEYSVTDSSPVSVVVLRLERLIWRQRDMLLFPHGETTTSVPYAFTAYLVLCRKWISFLTLLHSPYHSTHSLLNVPDFVRYANTHPVFYVRQRSWELLLELQKRHVEFSRVILEEACREENLPSLTTLFSEQDSGTLQMSSYFGYQADSVPSIPTKQMFLRYYILGLVSSLSDLSWNEALLHSTHLYFVERVDFILKQITFFLASWYAPPKSHSLEYYLVMLFTEQDDLMCMLFTKVLKLCRQSLNSEEQQHKKIPKLSLNIHPMVFCWLYQIDFDEYVLLDLINSSETEFLTFFVKYLNAILYTEPEDFLGNILEGDSGRFTSLLEKLSSVLERLQDKNLIPFCCEPLIRKMRQVLRHILPIASTRDKKQRSEFSDKVSPS